MRTELKITNPRAGRSRRALTLIELIGALAVLAILAAVLVPALIRQMDKIAGDQESASLKSFSDALQQSILRNRVIPATNNLASTIATELGVDIAKVFTNPRRINRGFLVDPALQIGSTTAGQAYQQTNTGSAILPVSPRMLIVSSIGSKLPNGLTNGVVPSAADFTNIWNTADGTVPAAPAFAGWAGSGEDLKIERVNLSPLFVRLMLSFYASTPWPRYSIDSTSWATAIQVTTNSPIDSYFIQNSILTLYTHLTNIDSQQILIRNDSFVYNQNVWQASILGGFLLGGLDIATVVDQFLKAPSNPRAQFGTNQQAIIVAKTQDYMDAYTTWADAGFPNGVLKTAAGNAQTAMKTAVQGQYLANSYDPPAGGVPCPP